MLIFFVIISKANSYSEKDSVTIYNSKEKIIQTIQFFSRDNQEAFKNLIKEYCPYCKCLNYLDNIEIVAEPLLQIDANCVTSAPENSLYKYYFKNKSKTNSIFNCFAEPIINLDTLIISLRLYNKNKEQTDHIELTYHMNEVLINTDKEDDLKPMVLQVNFNTNDTISNTFLKNRMNILYRTPYNAIVFDLNIHNISLNRFIVLNNKIYSIECLINKFNSVFPNEAPPKGKYLEEIMSYPEDKLCDCDIDNYLTEPK